MAIPLTGRRTEPRRFAQTARELPKSHQQRQTAARVARIAQRRIGSLHSSNGLLCDRERDPDVWLVERSCVRRPGPTSLCQAESKTAAVAASVLEKYSITYSYNHDYDDIRNRIVTHHLSHRFPALSSL